MKPTLPGSPRSWNRMVPPGVPFPPVPVLALLLMLGTEAAGRPLPLDTFRSTTPTATVTAPASREKEEPAGLPPPSTPCDFRFLDAAQRFPDAYSPEDVACMEPLPWDSAGLRRMRSHLVALKARLPFFMAEICDGGHLSFYRARNQCESGEGKGPEPDRNCLAWYIRSSKSIVLTSKHVSQRYFNHQLAAVVPDRWVLLHELAHAHLEERGWPGELRSEFLELTDWRHEAGEYTLPVHVHEREARSRDLRSLIRKTVTPAAARAAEYQRSYEGKPARHPTAYSTSEPEEHLAELITCLHLDPMAATYIDQRLALWVLGTFLR